LILEVTVEDLENVMVEYAGIAEFDWMSYSCIVAVTDATNQPSCFSAAGQ